MVQHSTGIQLSFCLCSVGVLMLAAGCQQADSLGLASVAAGASREIVTQTADIPAEKQTVEIAAVIEANSKVMDEIGKIAEVMNESTDIIMRFNHFTDGHTTPVKLCPECYSVPANDDADGIEDPEEKIPETMAQLLKVSQELHMSARRFSSHLKAQRTALQSHLKKLRAGKLEHRNP